MKKKLFMFLMLCTLSFAFTACGGGEDSSSKRQEEDADEDEDEDEEESDEDESEDDKEDTAGEDSKDDADEESEMPVEPEPETEVTPIPETTPAPEDVPENNEVVSVDAEFEMTSNLSDVLEDYCDEVVTLTFVSTLENARIDAVDVSANQDKTVLFWMNMDGNAFIGAEGGVKAPQDCENLFIGFSGVRSIDFSTCFDTGNVTDMGSMFGGCYSLLSLDLRSFDTGNVTDTECMFANCESLTSLDLSSFDTGNVTNMYAMFGGCSSLTSLDLSSFDISNVINMEYIFDGTSLTVENTNLNWNNNAADAGMEENAVHEMTSDLSSALGDYCEQIVTLTFVSTLENAETDTVDVSAKQDGTVLFWMDAEGNAYIGAEGGVKAPKDCDNMFEDFYALESIDFNTSFDTGNVTYMMSMFQNCTALTSVDVSGFDTSNVTYMSYMFAHCEALKSIDVSNFDTGNVTNLNGMFQNCYALESLDVSNFDTSNVGDMSYMFYGCGKLTGLDLSNFDTTNAYSLYNMFGNTDLSSENTNLVIK